MSALRDHLQAHLGTQAKLDRIGLEAHGRVVEFGYFENQPCDGATTLVTAGLSELPNHRLHEELVMSAWSGEFTVGLRQVVELIVRQLAEGRAPLLYGDVIGPAGPLAEGTKMEALYVCQPTYFDDGFAAFDADDGCRIRLRWLIPIYASEVRIIAQRGSEYFETLLEDVDPDLLSLGRRPIE
jgi:hypothetical protein